MRLIAAFSAEQNEETSAFVAVPSCQSCVCPWPACATAKCQVPRQQITDGVQCSAPSFVLFGIVTTNMQQKHDTLK